MEFRQQTKQLVAQEKYCVALTLKNLTIVEGQKLFSDYGYPSSFKYFVRELGYSEGEANIRVAAVKLAIKDKSVVEKVGKGELSLTNAAQVNAAIKAKERETGETAKPEMVQKALDLASGETTRKAKEKLRKELKLKMPRKETVTLDEKILNKLDRVAKLYGDVVTPYELLDILLEEKLKTPVQPQRYRNLAAKNSRYIPAQVKHQVYDGKCKNCGTQRDLQYDHIKEYAKGGDNSAKNIQLLCSNCNQRKQIVNTTTQKISGSA